VASHEPRGGHDRDQNPSRASPGELPASASDEGRDDLILIHFASAALTMSAITPV
jgi:hypothetical protein